MYSAGRVLASSTNSSGSDPQNYINQEWQCMSAVSALRMWRQEEQMVKAVLDYIGNVRPVWAT